jgi:hypothetical protein
VTAGGLWWCGGGGGTEGVAGGVPSGHEGGATGFGGGGNGVGGVAHVHGVKFANHCGESCEDVWRCGVNWREDVCITMGTLDEGLSRLVG